MPTIKALVKLKYLLQLMRPKHWIKNSLVFTALFFSFSFNILSAQRAALAFIIFCFIASSIYILNDIFDRNKDKLHPQKKMRPIASGNVSIPEALILLSFLLVISAILLSFVSSKVLIVCAVYLILNLMYSIWLKSYAIIDVMIVAFGFVLRVMAGAYAINVPISHWLLLCTFFISLFMAFGKRKNEMDMLVEEKSKHRASISEYTDGFINQMISITAGISIVFYSLYTIDSHTVSRFGSDDLIYTTPIAVLGIFRYFHLLYNKQKGGDPVQLFAKDKVLIITLVVWIIAIFLIYYKIHITI